MKTKTVIFEGVITTPTGYASSKSSKKDHGKNTTYQALPVQAGRFIIPGEQLAGALRRAGMDDMLDAFPENPLASILSYYQMRVGGIAGFGKIYKFGQMTALRRSNPFLSLWGKAGVRGHLGMGHAVGPVTETVTVLQGKDGPYTKSLSNAERVQGFRADDLARNPETEVPESFWSQREVLRFAGKSPETAKKVAVYAKNRDFFGFSLLDESNELALDISEEATEEEGGSKKLTNIQNGYGGFEYMPPATRFDHCFSVTGTEVEILLLMASFNGFARNPRLGGHWHHNLGWVDMRYTSYLLEDDLRLAPREMGTLTINSHMKDKTGPALATTGMVTEWMDAYLTVRRKGFSDMDLNAGVEDEFNVIQANLNKIAKDAEKAEIAQKSRKALKNKEVDHVA